MSSGNAQVSEHDLYVSPSGKDKWSGKLPEASADGTDGPLATVAAAQTAIRSRKSQSLSHGPVTVWLREGRHELAETLTFTPADSGPACYRAWPGESPVLSGGERIGGWQEGSIAGRTVWVADLPEVAEGNWSPRQLFVNGLRCRRARMPKEGFYWIEEIPGVDLKARRSKGAPKSKKFRVTAGQISADWKNLNDVEIVYHPYWRNPFVTCADKDVLVSLWQLPDRVMLGVYNYNGKQAKDATLKVDLDKLNLVPQLPWQEFVGVRDLWKADAKDPGGELDFHGRTLSVNALRPHTLRLIGIRRY